MRVSHDAEPNAAPPTAATASRLARRGPLGPMTAPNPTAAPTPATDALVALVARGAGPRPRAPRAAARRRGPGAAAGGGARGEPMAPGRPRVRVKETFRSTPCLHLSSQQVEMLLERAITWVIRGYYGHEACSVR